MIRYILRRLVQMVPTVFGVVLITFILFNLVGGSPGRMTLGDKASARELEIFDEQRGFNLPLFWGHYKPTRIYAETDFSRSPGPWAGMEGVAEPPEGRKPGLYLQGPAEIPVPLAFEPMEGNAYVWFMTYEVVRNGGEPIRLQFAEGQAPVVLDASGRIDETDQSDLSGQSDAKSRPVLFLPDDALLRIDGLYVRRVNDHPWQSQFSDYLGRLAQFDFGYSHSAGQPVMDLLKRGIIPTLCLATPILIGEAVVSLVFALACAYYRNRLFDRIILVGSVALMSVNYLVWIVAGQYLLGFKLGLFPVWGYASWHYLLLPVIIGVIHGIGPNVRFYRTIMLEEMNRDYVRTARAKGVGTGGILFRHVLKNAMIPVITNVVLSLPFLYTGSLLLESFFGIPGLGYLSVNAINSSDVDVVRAVVLIGSLLYLTANLAADLLYVLVDPRVKLS